MSKDHQDDTQIIDPREVRYQAERRRRLIRARARKKKRRRQVIFFTVLGLIVLLIIFGLFRLFSSSRAKSQTRQPLATGGIWHMKEAMGLDNSARAFSGLEERVHEPKRVMSRISNIKLAQGKNYISQAEDYAYDTKEIREIIQGKREYGGPGKLAFLTFDDGPSDNITPRILDALKEGGARGTFFLQANQVSEARRPIMLRTLAEGHALALHSYSHDYKAMYPGRSGSTQTILREADLSQETVQSVLPEGFYSGVWRYPGGHMSWSNLAPADEGLAAKGIEWIDWNVMTGDAEPKSRRPTSTEGILDFLDKQIDLAGKPDVIVVLMHDAKNKDLTAQALPSVIRDLRGRGYEFGILK